MENQETSTTPETDQSYKLYLFCNNRSYKDEGDGVFHSHFRRKSWLRTEMLEKFLRKPRFKKVENTDTLQDVNIEEKWLINSNTLSQSTLTMGIRTRIG